MSKSLLGIFQDVSAFFDRCLYMYTYKCYTRTAMYFSQLYSENPCTFANNEDLDEMQHNVSFHQGLHGLEGKIDLQTMFENYSLTPLDMYNGLSQVYCINPEGIIH